MKVLAVLAVCFATAYAGVVHTVPCTGNPGEATWREMRINGAEGEIAHLTAGTPYPCEGDFIPAVSCAMLHLHVKAHVFGSEITIIDAQLPNSSVQPGSLYTVTFTITPNDILRGQTFDVSANVSCDENKRTKVCRSVRVRIQ